MALRGQIEQVVRILNILCTTRTRNVYVEETTTKTNNSACV